MCNPRSPLQKFYLNCHYIYCVCPLYIAAISQVCTGNGHESSRKVDHGSQLSRVVARMLSWTIKGCNIFKLSRCYHLYLIILAKHLGFIGYLSHKWPKLFLNCSLLPRLIKFKIKKMSRKVRTGDEQLSSKNA